jgi:hypothetical protein
MLHRIATLAFLCLAVVPALDAAASTLETGTIELSGRVIAARDSYSGHSDHRFDALGEVGYFVSDRLEIALGAIYRVTENDSPADPDHHGWSFVLRWNFTGEGRVTPFVGLGAGVVAYEDEVSETTFPAVDVGLRLHVGDSASLNAQLGYSESKNHMGFEDLDRTGFRLALGISVFP